jgi:hypothetical protein
VQEEDRQPRKLNFEILPPCYRVIAFLFEAHPSTDPATEASLPHVSHPHNVLTCTTPTRSGAWREKPEWLSHTKAHARDPSVSQRQTGSQSGRGCQRNSQIQSCCKGQCSETIFGNANGWARKRPRDGTESQATNPALEHICGDGVEQSATVGQLPLCQRSWVRFVFNVLPALPGIGRFRPEGRNARSKLSYKFSLLGSWHWGHVDGT